MGIISVTGPVSRRLVFAMASLLVVSCSDPAAESQSSLVSAKKYLAENNPRAAAIELKNALQANAENAEARYLLGLTNLDFGDVAGAEKEFRRAIKAGWNQELATIGLARALIDRQAYQNVIDEIEIKESYSANSQANLYGLKALAQASLGKLQQASKTLADGTELDSTALHVLKTAIQLALVNKDMAEADSKLNKALELYPDDPGLLLLNSSAALKSNDAVRATDALEKVIAQEPDNFTTVYGRQARLRLAGLQILEKKFEQASSSLALLLKLFPKDPQTNYVGGMLAFAQGEYSVAEERLLKVLQVAPDHPQTILLYGTVSFKQKNYEQAANYLSRYVDAVPDNLGARKLLGRTHMMLGQSDKAELVLRPALGTDADDVELLTLVGLNEMRGGDTASGIANLEKAAKSAPENTALRKELALAYIKSGEAELAIEELQAILSGTGQKGNTQTLLVLAHLKAGQPDKAIDAAFGILADNPDNPAAMTLVGSVYAATGDNIEARNYYEKALEQSPGNPQATLSMAQLEEAEGNITAAAEIHKSLVDTGVKSIVPMLALARLAEKQGDREALFTWLEKARAEAPQQLQPRIVLVEAYLRDRELQKAEVVVNESRKIAPEHSVVLSQWARVLMERKRFNEALNILKGLVEAEPDSVFARLLLGETYLNLKQFDDARSELSAALEKDPQSIGGLSLMARTELAQRRFIEADEIAVKLQTINPDFHRGYELSGDSWLGRQDFVKAKTAYEKAWEKQKSSGLAIKLSAVSARSGTPEDGIEVLRSWLKEHADDIRVLQILGTQLQSNGQKDEARQVYERTLELHPENLIALNNLAGIYSKEKNSKALGLAERAYRVAPDKAGVKDTYGWILVQEGKLEQGRSLLKQAHEALPNSAEISYHYAVALIRSGAKSEGAEMLKNLLRDDTPFDGREEAEKLLSE